MSETCLGCYGARKVRGADPNTTQQCVRCHGSGREPVDELLYVAALNRRVYARLQKAA